LPASGCRSGEQSHQGGLARAVHADERDPVARAEPPRDVAQEGTVAERERHVVGLEHLVAQARAREPQQLRGVARLGDVGDERVGGLDAELRLRRPGGRPAAQPGELLAHEHAAALVAHGGDPVALRAGENVGRVAALVLVHAAVDDLPGRGADRVEEPAVVRHDQQRAAARREMAGEPVDPLDVEVVRRLVEEQQLGAVEERVGQRDPAALPARERADARVQPVREPRHRDAAEQAVEHGAERRVPRPLVVGAAADELAADGARRIEVVRLPEQCELRVARPGQGAGVGLLRAGDEP
jgi:hypothetical protein